MDVEADDKVEAAVEFEADAEAEAEVDVRVGVDLDAAVLEDDPVGNNTELLLLLLVVLGVAVCAVDFASSGREEMLNQCVSACPTGLPWR